MDQEIAMKVYKRANEILLAACDSDLLGKTFKEGKLQIEVSPEFYDDARVNKQLFLQNLQLSTISNLVGETTINYAVEAGLVDKSSIIWIDGVPHAQICSM
jgi:hypothetical protein